MGIVCLGFRARRSNTLHGFVDVLLEQTHLQIKECTVHQKGDSRWIGLPARPQLTSDGTAKRDGNGKVQYTSILQFEDREAADQFSAAAIAALLDKFPDAFDHPADTG